MSLPLPDANDPRNSTGGGIYVPARAGLQRWFSGDVYSVKLTAADTNGSIGIVQGSVPPGGGPIPHTHADQDETFYVLNGELEFLHGDRTFLARTGDLVHVPRQVRHRFLNVGFHPAQLLFLYTPGGSEGLFVEGVRRTAPRRADRGLGTRTIRERTHTEPLR
jgi:quercetin dioxygenase-like cupin family protein